MIDAEQLQRSTKRCPGRLKLASPVFNPESGPAPGPAGTR